MPLTVLEAMAREEGFYVKGERPQRNNNPLDLEWNAESNEFGATHGDPRFAVFPDAETGWNAGRRWLSVPARFEEVPVSLIHPLGRILVRGYLGATIAEVIGRFAPAEENDVNSYTRNVCAWSEKQSSDVLTLEMLEFTSTQTAHS